MQPLRRAAPHEARIGEPRGVQGPHESRLQVAVDAVARRGGAGRGLSVCRLHSVVVAVTKGRARRDIATVEAWAKRPRLGAATPGRPNLATTKGRRRWSTSA